MRLRTHCNTSAGVAVHREKFDLNDGVALRTLDVFAGCGGLSEGLHQVRQIMNSWPGFENVTLSVLTHA